MENLPVEKKLENEITLSNAPMNAALIASLKGKASGEVALILESVGSDIKENEALFKNDILIPKVWLLQSSSELVKDLKKYPDGVFVNSISQELLAGEGEVLRFIVLRTFKRWQTFKLKREGTKIKKEFVSSEVMQLGKNENLPYEETVNGEDFVRRQVISCYVLLEKDAIAGISRPFVIDFAATSKHGGRVIVSDISTLEGAGLSSVCVFFEMHAKSENFEDGTAFTKQVKLGGPIPESAWPFLLDCRKSIITMQNQIEIDDQDLLKDGSKGIDAEERNVTTKVSGANTRI